MDKAMTALWINNPGFDTDHRHRHRGGMLTKTPPPTELQIPATVTTLVVLPCIHAVSNDAAARRNSEGQFSGNSAQKDRREHCKFHGSQPPRWRRKFGGHNNTTIFDNIDTVDLLTPIR